MKKLFAVVCAVLVTSLSFGLTACDDRYIAPENHCIVGLHEDYTLYSESEGGLCEPIDKEIKGIEKEDGINYYSVVKNADYTILVDNFIDAEDGLSWAEADDIVTNAAYWQGHIITEFVKEYREELPVQREVFYTTNYSQVNGNVPVTFDKNCTVKAYIEPYINVGGIFEVVEKGKPLEGYEDVCLNEDGTVGEKDGVYYLLLKDKVCTHRDAWKTNFEVTDYTYTYVENALGLCETGIKAQFTVKPPVVTENQELWLYQVCRTYGGKHFVYPLVYVDTMGFTMPVGKHELNLAFENAAK